VSYVFTIYARRITLKRRDIVSLDKIRHRIGLPVITTRLIKIEREFVGNADLYVKENLFGPSELGRKMSSKEGGFSIRDDEFG
jgi:hypothetical protein